MSAVFTPGPWSVSTVPYGSGKRHNILGRTGKFAVAHIYGDPRPAAKNLANARLIAAAPELYEALDALLEAAERHVFGNECLSQRNAARAVLRQARGEQQ